MSTNRCFLPTRAYSTQPLSVLHTISDSPFIWVKYLAGLHDEYRATTYDDVHTSRPSRSYLVLVMSIDGLLHK